MVDDTGLNNAITEREIGISDDARLGAQLAESPRSSLLIMAKEPKAGSAKTRLVPALTPEQAASLAQCFLLDSVELGHKAATEVNNLDVKVACTPPNAGPYFENLLDEVETIPQVGETLGHRLDHVINHELSTGYQFVAAINSDGPSLPMASIVAAFRTLNDPGVDVVLGPTEDGGYYLVGVKQRWPELTINVEMSTSNVLADTLAVAESLGATVKLLPIWFDVDEPEDLERLRRDIDRGVSCGQNTVDFLTAHSAQLGNGSRQPLRNLSVAVIAPALNEAGNIGFVVDSVLATATKLNSNPGSEQFADDVELSTTMIVVDNGSTDETVAVATAAGAVIVDEPRRGYGYACKAGADRALAIGADVLVFIDGDQSSRADELGLVLHPIVSNSADLVLGSRTEGTIDKGAMAPHQRFGNWLTSRLMRKLYQIDVTDLGPYRAITADLYRQLSMKEMTFGWPTEMMVKAAIADATVVEVPVAWKNRVEGKSKISGTVKGSALAAWHILKVTLRYVRR